jgi:[ribosomal protein S18]-alanine N-acetyltransferase
MAGWFTGYVETVEPAFAGWVIDRRRAGPVRFSVVIDGKLRFALSADRPRPDVAAPGSGPLNCGFELPLPVSLFDGAAHAIDLILDNGGRLELPAWRSPVVLGPVSCRIDRLGPADQDDVATLLRLTNAESGVDPDAISELYVSGWIAAGHILLSARAAPGLVGYAILARRGAIGTVGLSVLRHYRRKGLGERLMRALLAAVPELEQIDQVWLAVAPENLPARRLYEKLGFVDRAYAPPSLVVPAGYLAMLWRPDR